MHCIGRESFKRDGGNRAAVAGLVPDDFGRTRLCDDDDAYRKWPRCHERTVSFRLDLEPGEFAFSALQDSVHGTAANLWPEP